MLVDHIDADMGELSVLPRGTHLGELEFSFILDDLPRQFLTRYDYEFLYALEVLFLVSWPGLGWMNLWKHILLWRRSYIV